MNRQLVLSMAIVLAAPAAAQTTSGYSPRVERIRTLEISLATTAHGRNRGAGADT